MKLRILSFQALALGAALLFLACPQGNITTNQAPIVNAGAAPTATVGTAISITATATDVDRNPLTYEWAFDSRPAGSSATLSGATSLTVSFTPDVAGS